MFARMGPHMVLCTVLLQWDLIPSCFCRRVTNSLAVFSPVAFGKMPRPLQPFQVHLYSQEPYLLRVFLPRA